MRVWCHGLSTRVATSDLPVTKGFNPNSAAWDSYSKTATVNLYSNLNSGVCLVIENDGDRPIVCKFNVPESSIGLHLVVPLKLKGCSRSAYEQYDQSHVPNGLRLPDGSRDWEDRPFADKWVPEIVMDKPIHLTTTQVTVPAKSSRTFWIEVAHFTDIGIYPITIDGTTGSDRHAFTFDLFVDRKIRLLVDRNTYAIFDFPMACAYLNLPKYAHEALEPERSKAFEVLLWCMETASRHGITLWHPWVPAVAIGATPWLQRLQEGNLHLFGAYGDLFNSGMSDANIHLEAKRLRQIFSQRDLGSKTYLMHVFDEAMVLPGADPLRDFREANRRCKVLKGSGVYSMVTTSLYDAKKYLPDADFVFFTPVVSRNNFSREVFDSHPSEEFQAKLGGYNGQQCCMGSQVTEDFDGLRTVGLAQARLNIPWMLWSFCLTHNPSKGYEKNSLWSDAQTFGSTTGNDDFYGETGDAYQNGDGTFVYLDTLGEHGVSLRLKAFREGQTDFALWSAAFPDAKERMAAVQDRHPRFIFPGVTTPEDPTYVSGPADMPTTDHEWAAMRDWLMVVINPQDPVPAPAPVPVPVPQPEDEMQKLRSALTTLVEHLETLAKALRELL